MVLKGFRRILPSAPSEAEERAELGLSNAEYAPISKNVLNWLPAIELFGEGIFIELNEEKIEEIVRKTLTLRKGEKVYHIKDEIKLPISSNDSNPEEVYKILDKDKSEDNKKFFNVRLYPSCYGGLLSCNYYIKITNGKKNA